jgi:hypothetical protein
MQEWRYSQCLELSRFCGKVSYDVRVSSGGTTCTEPEARKVDVVKLPYGI